MLSSHGPTKTSRTILESKHGTRSKSMWNPTDVSFSSPYVWWRRAYLQLLWISFLLILGSVIFGIVMTPPESRSKTWHSWISYSVCGLLLVLRIVNKYLQSTYHQKTYIASKFTNTVWESLYRYIYFGLLMIVICSTPFLVYTGSADGKLEDISNNLSLIIIGSILGRIVCYIYLRIYSLLNLYNPNPKVMTLKLLKIIQVPIILSK